VTVGPDARESSGPPARRLPPAAERVIMSLPEPARPHVRESLSRLASVRTPAQATQTFSDEVAHLLRVLMPIFVRHPLVRTPAAARRVAAFGAASAATVEQADELLAAVSFGSTVAPGMITVLTVGVAATVLEAYAAASVRVHQLRYAGVDVDADAVAIDVHAALFDDRPSSARKNPVAGRLARRGATRIARRWAAGLVPVVGIAYAGYDARRTIDRILLRPIPNLPGSDRSR
jgi:hypothetical protein